MTYENITLKAKNLKCIGDDLEGFDGIFSVNVIVGRNNSGKSSLIDLVERAVAGDVEVSEATKRAGKPPEIFLSNLIREVDVEKSFQRNTSGGDLGGNHYQVGMHLVNARLFCALRKGADRAFVAIEPTTSSNVDIASIARQAGARMDVLANQPQHNPFFKKNFRRLHAERNIQPEIDQPNAAINGDGSGATNVIQQFLNKAHLPRELVQKTLLQALNEIFNPDTIFDEITCRQLADGRWEIFLYEKAKGLVPLSQSGSGLKTVILALCFIHLAPVLANASLRDFVMAFEELENNLHPALQRRLITYLSHQAVNEEFPIFLTTHSNIAIDLLNKQPHAQIIHVTHDGSKSTAKVVKAFVDNSGVLDDLDVRASDLLQSNGVIWVEGPSDRTYINRWIFLWSNGELVEGNHYQAVFYGGRLLAHLSADEEEDESAVSILKVNRNAAVIIDSDKRNQDDSINSTKKRIVTEIEAIGGLSWVTAGREVENYIPIRVLRQWRPDLIIAKGPSTKFSSVFEYLDRVSPGLGTKYANKKPLLAEEVGLHTTREDLVATPELAASISDLCARIRLWNRLPEPSPL